MAEDLISFQVTFKGKTIQVENLTLNHTIQNLKEQLVEETSIPVEFQKLFYKGLLNNDFTLQECKFKNGIKVLLIGSSQQDIQAVKAADSKVIHQPLKSKYAVNPYKNTRIEDSFDNKYTFHKIEVIEHFPNPDRARALLEKLRDDRGIRGIMSHYKWSVGILQELSPAEKTILGFNRNAGQLISLRLRTNDMQGFRHYPEIRRVLLHELAHNVWSEHDDNFHRLNRQLNNDVVSMDWTVSKSHKISNEEFYNPPEEEEIDKRSWEGGTYVLGGDQSRANILPRRELLAEAALIRLTKEEKELAEGCGSHRQSDKSDDS
ncbi:WLM-domain-containing protein [Gigaspora margarita]|uniref:WLM-domain-containing protein n=1 Tax=Gigaspora margarita TaxID=4874 RepID=A0A8H4A902_GIGMA|nr:WLM-domain-containing protein [Gigaspora margarita]